MTKKQITKAINSLRKVLESPKIIMVDSQKKEMTEIIVQLSNLLK